MDSETGATESVGSGGVVFAVITSFLSGRTPQLGKAFPQERQQFTIGPEADYLTRIDFLDRAFYLAGHPFAGHSELDYECSPHHAFRLGLRRL